MKAALLLSCLASLALGQSRPLTTSATGGVSLSTQQTISGAKTFSASLTASAGISTTTGDFSGVVTSSVASGSNAYVSATGGRWNGGATYWYTDAIGGGRWITPGGLFITGNADFGNVALSGKLTTSSATVTVADDGAGTSPAGTVTPTGAVMYVACNDANGCTMTLSETGATDGQQLTIVSIGTGVANFADTSGVSETAGAFAAGGSGGGYDSISYTYVTDRWVERCRSNN